MKIPRNISGDELVKALAKYGYYVTRQTGSHLRLTTTENGEHHITIPAHLSRRSIALILGLNREFIRRATVSQEPSPRHVPIYISPLVFCKP